MNSSKLYLDRTRYSCFSKLTDKANINLPREHWGNCYWRMLHTMSLHYPITPSSTDQEEMMMFLKSLSVTFPCKKCKVHYRNAIEKCDLQTVTSSRDRLFCFLVDLHNEVNLRNNKRLVSYQEAFQMYH